MNDILPQPWGWGEPAVKSPQVHHYLHSTNGIRVGSEAQAEGAPLLTMTQGSCKNQQFPPLDAGRSSDSTASHKLQELQKFQWPRGPLQFCPDLLALLQTMPTGLTYTWLSWEKRCHLGKRSWQQSPGFLVSHEGLLVDVWFRGWLATLFQSRDPIIWPHTFPSGPENPLFQTSSQLAFT